MEPFTGDKNSSKPVPGNDSPAPMELKALREAYRVLDSLIRNEQISIAVIQDKVPRIVLVNRGMSRLTGYSEEELLALSFEEQTKLIHPDNRDEFVGRYYQRLDRDDQPDVFELRIIRKDGSFRWVNAYGLRIVYMGEDSLVVSFMDITDSKNTETALRESREQYRLLFERTPVSIFYYDTGLVITHFNKKFVELLKSSKKTLTGFDLHAVRDRSILACIEMPLKGKKAFYEGPYRAVTSDTSVIISMRSEPVYDDKGNITGGVCIIEDRTKQHVTEKALLQSERRFKEMIDLSPLPISVMNRDMHIVYANDSCRRLFGYTNEDVPDIIAWWEKAYPDPAYRQMVADDWVEGFKAAHERNELFGPKEYKVTSADGSVHDIEFHVVPLGELAFIIMSDLTRHRKAEEELLRTKKIESLGILAGGIAHDFNNILTAILGNVSLARMEIGDNERVDRVLRIVENAAWRASGLTQQLLTFSCGGMPVRRRASVRSLLVDTVEFVLRGSGVRCEFDLAEDLWSADIDEGQISQVIHNLVLNSRQAMNESGTLKISASNYLSTGDDMYLPAGEYLMLLFADTGPGIPEEIIPNIFDPFFTTKSSGNGLGLAVTYSIIKKHDGYIRVLRGKSGGSVFEVMLPSSRECNDAAPKKEELDSGHGGSVLVMDDDELVLDICARMLQKMGYMAVKARNGDEAISLYRDAMESGRPFDCVIMDLTIPGGAGGREVLNILREYDPSIKAIVSSGYSNDPVMSQYRTYGFVGVSVKPYSFDELKEAVKAAITHT